MSKRAHRFGPKNLLPPESKRSHTPMVGRTPFSKMVGEYRTLFAKPKYSINELNSLLIFVSASSPVEVVGREVRFFREKIC